VYRTYSAQPIERPTIVVRYRELSPVADGVIGEKEYGPDVTITWSQGPIGSGPYPRTGTEEGRPHVPSGASRLTPSSPSGRS
jgi:hypothetical protein